MSAQHTPGPWKVITEQTAREVEVFEIADVSHFRVICDGRGDGFAAAGDAFADATLIAFAPELRDAAVRALEWFRVYGDQVADKFGNGPTDELCDCEAELRAAIAKATGSAA
jgi:hypothetical protein